MPTSRVRRRATLLAGDVVLTNLSAGLGFDGAGRDANIRWIGFVAAEIVRHRGATLCAAISPPSEWTPHFNTQYYEGDWSGIALRAPVGAHVALYPDPTAEGYEDTETLSRCPSVSDVLREFQCPTEAVRFLRLGAGAMIREHRDHKLSYEDGLARVHIPVKTSTDVEFYLDGNRVQMNEGEAWYLNFNLPHSVRNNGSDERVHLVIDCVVNDWFRHVVAYGRLD